MKHIKILGLLAIAATALTAFAASASATILTMNGSQSNGPVHAGNEGKVVLDSPIATIECSSTFGGSITSSGGKGNPATGPLLTLDFTSCASSWHVTTLKFGGFQIDWTSGNNGALKLSGVEVDTTRFGITCVYLTSATPIGTITGSSQTKGAATLDISGAIPIEPVTSSGLCGSASLTWTGSYSVSTPAKLDIDDA